MRPRSRRGRALAPTLALLCGLGACAGGDGALDVGPYRHVLWISLDTARADHLSCYRPAGEALADTPHLDALAARGVRFDQAQATAPTTLASHCSWATGLHPLRHGVARNGFPLHEDNVTLAEHLRTAGFHGAAFLGSFALERRFGFDQGFSHVDQEFDLRVTPGSLDQDQRTAEGVVDALLGYLDAGAVEAERLLLFAHLFDPHAPYAPPEAFARRHVEPGAPLTSDTADVERAVRARQARRLGTDTVPGHAGVIGRGLPEGLVRGPNPGPSPTDLHLAALYAAEMEATDAAIGRLLDGLAARGLLEETLVVVTADHGETLWEHGDAWNHGLWVYQGTLRVPFLLALPDGRGAGRVVAAPVSGVDLLPTLLELLVLPPATEVQGRSLVPAIDGAEPAVVPVFAEATQPFLGLERAARREGRWTNWLKPHAVRRGRWKYVNAPYLQVEQLFDLEVDPGEQADLLGPHAPPLVEDARVALDELRRDLAAFLAGADPRPSAFDPAQLEETTRRLQALGYGGADESEDPPPAGDGSAPVRDDDRR